MWRLPHVLLAVAVFNSRPTEGQVVPQRPSFDPVSNSLLTSGEGVTVIIPDSQWICYYMGQFLANNRSKPWCGMRNNECSNRSLESGNAGTVAPMSNVTHNNESTVATNSTSDIPHSLPNLQMQVGTKLQSGPIYSALNISAVGCRLGPTTGNASANVLYGEHGSAQYTISLTNAGIAYAEPPSGSLVRVGGQINTSALAEFLCITSSTDKNGGWPSEPACVAGDEEVCLTGRLFKGNSTRFTVGYQQNPLWMAVGCRSTGGFDSPVAATVQYDLGPIAGLTTFKIEGDKLRLNGPEAIPWGGPLPTSDESPARRRHLNSTTTANKPNSSTPSNQSDVSSPSPLRAPNTSLAFGGQPSPSPSPSEVPSPSPFGASTIDTKIPLYLVRYGETVSATAPNASSVCMATTHFGPEDALPSDDSPCMTCRDPKCLPNGKCDVESTASPVVIDGTLIIRAIACQDTRPSVAGTSSTNVTEARFKPGATVGVVEFSPVSNGVVKEFTQISMTAEGASLICWTDDISIDPLIFPYCHASGKSCISPAKDYRNSSITVSADLPRIDITARGCTDTQNTCEETGCRPLGTNSPRFSSGVFRVGIEAGKPLFSPPGGDGTGSTENTPMLGTKNVAILSNRASLVCWTAVKRTAGMKTERWGQVTEDGGVVKQLWLDSSQDSDPVGWPMPACDASGMFCLQGSQRGQATPSILFEEIGTLSENEYSIVEIRAIGCTDSTPGTGGGTNSNVELSTYRIVPRLHAPTFHTEPEGKTKFRGKSGRVVLREHASGADFFCISIAEYDRVLQGVTRLVDPPQCSDDGSMCLVGTKVDLDNPISVLFTSRIQAQACASSEPLVAASNRNSPVSEQIYFVMGGDDKVVEALDSLQNAISKHPWAVTWDLVDSEYCDAFGVTCDTCADSEVNCASKDHVKSLSLSYNMLEGDFSKADLSGFAHSLQVLELAGNSLNGNLPKSLFSLTKLTTLSLFYNKLSGDISSDLGDLTNLVTIDLDENGFTGPIPESISKLTKLTRLDLGNNALTGEIPKVIAKLTNLVKLDLSNNELEGRIPKEFDEMTKLKTLNVAGNPGLDSTLTNVLCVRTQSCLASFDEDGGARLAPGNPLYMTTCIIALLLALAFA